MLSSLWYSLLYQPLFNVLIWLYNTIAEHNMGWAVVWLTLLLRVVLLPLTVIAEYTEVRRVKAAAEAERVILAFKNDRIKQQEEARKIIRRYHISPWAKVLMLGIQLLVLILLYQVFIHGINGQRMVKTLYNWVDIPGTINPYFYGFNTGVPHDWWWSSAAALYLLIAIYLEHRRQHKKLHTKWDKSEVFYLFSFPLFTLAVLWYLPMVKSLFILTTMIFSDIVHLLRRIFMAIFKAKPVH